MTLNDRAVVVRQVETDDEVAACARIMSSSEPWITLRRDYDASLAAMRDPSREVYVARPEGEADVIGFLVLSMRGAFVGYIQSVGELRDYIVRGHSEWLLRKSIAPLADWTTSRGAR